MTSCRTDIGTHGIGGNSSPLDPDIVYLPPPNQGTADTGTDADNAIESHPAEPVTSNLD